MNSVFCGFFANTGIANIDLPTIRGMQMNYKQTVSIERERMYIQYTWNRKINLCLALPGKKIHRPFVE